MRRGPQQQRIANPAPEPAVNRFQPRNPVKPVQVPFNGYVRCDMSRHDATDFATWCGANTDEIMFRDICRLANSDYKLSVGTKGEDVMAAMTDQDPDRGSYGYVLTAFGSTAESATRAVLYKHFVKLSEDWAAETDPDGFHVR